MTVSTRKIAADAIEIFLEAVDKPFTLKDVPKYLTEIEELEDRVRRLFQEKLASDGCQKAMGMIKQAQSALANIECKETAILEKLAKLHIDIVDHLEEDEAQEEHLDVEAYLEALSFLKHPLAVLHAQSCDRLSKNTFRFPANTVDYFHQISSRKLQLDSGNVIVKKGKCKIVNCVRGIVKKEYIAESASAIAKEKIFYMFFDHPNIPRIYGIFQNCILLEEAKCDLHHCVTSSNEFYTPENVMSYIKGIVSAIRYLGIKGCVHLDIKPENILIFNPNLAKLTDFAGSHNWGVKGGGRYTLNYAAPELNKEEVSPRLDVWSLGVTVYYTMYKKIPRLADVASMNVKEECLMDPKGLLRRVVKMSVIEDPQSRALIRAIQTVLNAG